MRLRTFARSWPLIALLAGCDGALGDVREIDAATIDPADASIDVDGSRPIGTDSGMIVPVDAGSDAGPPPAEPAVHYVGRYDDADPSRVRMGWSGVGLVARFDGTGASVRLEGSGGFFTIVVDGMVQPRLERSGSGAATHVLASGLAPGEHTVELYRRTEGSFGATAVLGVDIEGELLAPPPVTRRIEVIGDSISCGFGNEGVAPCPFSADTENHYLTYGAIAARALGAELHTIAWSGKGVVYNYGDDRNQPMPEIYDRAVPTEGASWDFTWQPDVVVINLGTNDFSTDGDPSEDLFVSTYVDFLTNLRAFYPEAFLLAISPSLFGAEATMVDRYLQSVVDQRAAEGDSQVGFANVNVTWIGSGCSGHPSLATHEGMGERLVTELRSRLEW